MVLLARSKMEDQPTGQDAGPLVKLTSPIVPPDQTEEERQYLLVVNALVRRLNLETTRVILGDMVTASAGGVAFWNPHMAAVLPRPVQERKATGNQGATVEVLGRKDAE